MLVSLRNLSIGLQIGLGFALVLSALVLVGGFGLWNLTSANNIFADYRSIARETNQLGRIQANLLLTRLNAKSFIIAPGEESVANVNERAVRTLEMITEARELGEKLGVTEMLDIAEAELQRYQQTFQEVTELQDVRNDIVIGQLNVLGPKIEQDLTNIMNSAWEDQDARAAVVAGRGLRALLLARLYVQRFLIQNDQASEERAVSEFAAFVKLADDLVAELQNPTHRQLASTVAKNTATYQDAFTVVVETIRQRNERILLKLDEIGPRVADLIEQSKLALKERQDQLGPQATTKLETAVIVTLVVVSVCLLFAIAIAWIMTRGLASPLGRITQVMNTLAQGKLDIAIPFTDRNNELGKMAQAVNVFRTNAEENDNLKNAQAQAERSAADERRKAAQTMADELETKIAGSVSSIMDASQELETASSEMMQTATSVSDQSASAASATQQAGVNVQSVSAATQQMTASVQEIIDQVARSHDVVSDARTKSVEATDRVKSLDTAAAQIGEVVMLISDIANQTNLLALNATIESARAGEAGKGFAVVAHEVKNLATQTAKATDDIAAQIQAIQAETNDTASAISSLSDTINEITEISSVIASAMEEQGAVTSEIARNAEQASTGVTDASGNVEELVSGANTSMQVAETVAKSASDLSKEGASLRNVMDNFLSEMRASA